MKKEKPIFQCKWCEKELIDDSPGKKKNFCSPSHQGRFYRSQCTVEEHKIKRTRNCEWCNKSFFAKLESKKCCTHTCARKLHKQNIKLPRAPQKCLGCSTTFTPTTNPSRYCSIPCKLQAQYGRKRVPEMSFTCKICKIEFKARRKNSKTCGAIPCKRAYANLMGGKFANTRNHYEKAFKKCGIQKVCDLCPYEYIDYHHINPIREGGSDELDNLALLCPNHHRLADRGKIDINELKKIAKIRSQRVQKLEQPNQELTTYLI